MSANLGMIALGKAKTLEKRLIKLEEVVEEIKKQIRVEDLRPTQEGESSVHL